MCNSNYTGALCGAAVSSIRPTVITRNNIQLSIQAKRICGEEDSSPSLYNELQGRGQLNINTKACECNAISSVDNTGMILYYIMYIY
jgi:hypothetical protein